MRSWATVALLVLACAGPEPRSIDVRIKSGDVELAGTLYTPRGNGPHPAVAIVHGSGPETRANYEPLALAFTRHGVAALIYDKRGTGQSTGDWRRSEFSALADDAESAINFLGELPEIDSTRIGIWGGSEGGWIAPWVASRSSLVAFVIVQSAPVVNAARQHLYQVEQLVLSSGGNNEDLERALTYVRSQHRYAKSREGWEDYARQRDSNQSIILRQLGGPTTADDWWWSWWRSKMAYDPLVPWSRVSVPILALWGEQDQTVPTEDSRFLLDSVLTSVGRSATLGILRFADHDLQPVGIGRAFNAANRLFRRAPGLTPAMEQMAAWAALQGPPATGQGPQAESKH